MFPLKNQKKKHLSIWSSPSQHWSYLGSGCTEAFNWEVKKAYGLLSHVGQIPCSIAWMSKIFTFSSKWSNSLLLLSAVATLSSWNFEKKQLLRTRLNKWHQAGASQWSITITIYQFSLAFPRENSRQKSFKTWRILQFRLPRRRWSLTGFDTYFKNLLETNAISGLVPIMAYITDAI